MLYDLLTLQHMEHMSDMIQLWMNLHAVFILM